MNQVLLRGMSDEEFLSAVRDDVKTDLEIMMVERLESSADSEPEFVYEAEECDGDCDTAENLQAEIDEAKAYIEKLCRHIAEKDLENELLQDELCPV
jgi:hypothetical protein